MYKLLMCNGDGAPPYTFTYNMNWKYYVLTFFKKQFSILYEYIGIYVLNVFVSDGSYNIIHNHISHVIIVEADLIL